MNAFKKLALVAAMSSMAFAASAMTSVDDADLSQVAGQDGVSIAANLNINIGSFVYTDTDVSVGGSISFNGIAFTGAVAATLDIISNGTFLTDASAANPNSVLGVTGGAGLSAFQPTGDVVKIALPVVDTTKLLNISVASIKMGNASTKSFGSIAINKLNMAGTTAYVWAH
jgi:hypothetical protein